MTTTISDGTAIRQEMIAACNNLAHLGFFISTWGNISVRVEEGMLITPSRMDYAQLVPEDIVLISMDGRKLRGERVPSSETALHHLVMTTRPDMGAIVHTHSPYASIIACAQRALPVVVEDMAQIIGGTVHCAPYTPGGRHHELAEAVTSALGDEAMAVLLANHGVLAGGRTLEEAMTACRVLEKAALLYLHAEMLGGCYRIPDAAVREERHRFLYKYGKPEA
jgi:L-fuculose-phosphate aldolase